MAEIRSKRQFFELWRAGCLGNRPRLFETLDEALASGLPKIGFRQLGKAGGGAWELAPREHLPYVHARWTRLHSPFLMDGSVPNDKTLIQGELCQTDRGLYAFVAVSPSVGLEPMRLTMAKGLHRSYWRAEANALMRRYIDASSLDDIRDLFDLYPDAVIEFAAFAVNVGNIPGRNTIIWEVRNY